MHRYLVRCFMIASGLQCPGSVTRFRTELRIEKGSGMADKDKEPVWRYRDGEEN